jgi:acyl carrier protein
MSSEPILSSIILETCREIFQDPKLELTPDTLIQNIPNWDSFGHIQLVIALEEFSGVRFSSEQIDGFRTLGDLDSSINQKNEKTS